MPCVTIKWPHGPNTPYTLIKYNSVHYCVVIMLNKASTDKPLDFQGQGFKLLPASVLLMNFCQRWKEYENILLK